MATTASVALDEYGFRLVSVGDRHEDRDTPVCDQVLEQHRAAWVPGVGRPVAQRVPRPQVADRRTLPAGRRMRALVPAEDGPHCRRVLDFDLLDVISAVM